MELHHFADEIVYRCRVAEDQHPSEATFVWVFTRERALYDECSDLRTTRPKEPNTPATLIEQQAAAFSIDVWG